MTWRRRHLGLQRLAFVLAVAAFTVGVAGWGLVSYLAADHSTARPALPVAVTVPPQAWLVRQIGGERVDVEVLLPPGASEHTYEPTPQQAARLARSRLIVRVGAPGLPFEGRLVAAIPRADGPRPEVVDMSRSAEVVSEPGARVSDPHLWLSPATMRRLAAETAAALSRLDAAGAPSYERRLRVVRAEIDGVAAAARADLADRSGRRLYVDHPAWTHLLHDYGIEQVAIERDGKEPSARQLVVLADGARRDGVRMLFVQPGRSARGARALAQEIGARTVDVDPLAEDWPRNLRRTTRLFREALGG
jgi:zinc transport system substrate-binding protein